MLALIEDGGAGGGGVSETAYTLLGFSRSFRVNVDQSTTPVVTITAMSDKYGVQYTWTILATTWDTDGAVYAASLKTGEVNAICGHAHVQDFRSEQDQGPSQQLYNYGVVTVGTEDQAITDELRIRMDLIGEVSAFAKIDQTWNRLVSVGAS